jgi:hypothetical protein
MKRLCKKIARALWRASGPVSRPIIRRFDNHILWLLSSFPTRADIPANLDLTLNSLVRELTRLQIHVEILQHQIDAFQSDSREEAHLESRLSVVGDIGQ